eukprot:TRINITY_DN26179_c0_g1_i2.p1 TRINITY_DN26179_c0_g1~~TRINITY_DN26179_c0_g1_i2.p1  ORF type:complete len:100 (-),score=7.70 TRINITY_DN26179_c0_g1_i2:824-1123(-)
MGGGLGSYEENGQKHRSRLSLSIEAVKMLISKLKPNDSIAMVTFNNQANTIFECTFKKDIDSDIFARMDQISAGGGTNIINGFHRSNELLRKWIETHQT